jgi:hypothetical protein
MSESRLKDALLSLFLRAEAEGRCDTAGHLMRALETLCAGPDAAPSPPTAPGGLDAAAEQRRSLEPNQGSARRSDAAGQGGRPDG